MQPFVTEDQSGLSEGLLGATNILGQALQQGREREQKRLDVQGLANQFPEGTIVNRLLRSPGGYEMLKGAGPVLSKLVEQESINQSSQNTINRWTPTQDDEQVRESNQIQEDVSDQGEPVNQDIIKDKYPDSPLDNVRQFSKDRSVKDTDSEVITTPAGTFRKSEFIDTPFGSFHPKQIKEFSLSSDPRLQKIAKNVNDHIVSRENQTGKELAAIRSEDRKLINEHAKPYLNTKKQKELVRGFHEAKDLVKSGNVSIDGNYIRNVGTAILDGRGLSELSEFLKTPEQRRLYSLIYNSLRTKDLGGSNPSTKEVLLSLLAKPSGLKGDEENLAILNDLIMDAEGNLESGKISLDVMNRGGHTSYPRYLMELDDKMDPFLKERRSELDHSDKLYFAKKSVKGNPPPEGSKYMFFPDGKVKIIPLNDIPMMQKSGGKLLNGK